MEGESSMELFSLTGFGVHYAENAFSSMIYAGKL